jgi:hypothetical protein
LNAAANFFVEGRNKRQWPINAASNLLPESEVTGAEHTIEPLRLRLNQQLTMPLRASNARFSVAEECCSVTNELVSAMTCRMYGTFIAFLGVVMLVLAASETFADPGVARAGGFAAQRPAFPRPGGRSHHNHRGMRGGWPTAADFFYGPAYDFDGSSYDEPIVAAPLPKRSDDLRYTCVYDIPWDYVHRCPQFVSPGE